MNKEILNKIEDIISYIKNSATYKKYLLIESQMEHNDDINKLVNEIKVLQKQATKEEHINFNSPIKLDEEIKDKLTQLNNIPLYSEYINTIDELNNTLQDIKNQIETYINRKTN